jgi:type III pantothenate kinase
MATSSTTLCIDFGNTRQKAALFAGGSLQEVIYFAPNDPEQALIDAVRLLKPERTILSSVINHHPDLEAQLAANTRFHLLKAGVSRLPFTTPVCKPSTIGADRLALCAAAVLLYPHQNNLVIGMGTAVTYNFINVLHQFLGGGISPGMLMRMRALNDYTAKLPITDPDWNVPLVGYDTKTNIQSGVVLGLAYEIEGFIAAYRQKYGAFNVLLTGGDSVHLVPHLKSLIFADADLLFKGLYAICDLNV